MRKVKYWGRMLGEGIVFLMAVGLTYYGMVIAAAVFSDNFVR